MSKVADSIRRGLKEALSYAEGKAKAEGFREHAGEATLARLDAVREGIGAVAGPSSLDDLRADRSRDR